MSKQQKELMKQLSETIADETAFRDDDGGEYAHRAWAVWQGEGYLFVGSRK